MPVMLNSQLLDRAKDNFMVVEIWNKSLTADDDMVRILLFVVFPSSLMCHRFITITVTGYYL